MRIERTLTITMVVVFGVIVFAAFAALDESLRVLAIAKYYLSGRDAVPPTIYLDHPFLTEVMAPHYVHLRRGRVVFQTNSLGFRSPEFALRKPPGTYRIVVVGGSAALWGSDNAHTFANMLMKMFNPGGGRGRRYEVIDAGVPGFTSTQELFLVQAEVISWDPDMVVVYDGFNDMFFGSMPTYRPNWVPRDEELTQFLKRPVWMEDPVERNIFILHLYRDWRRRRERARMTPPEFATDSPAGLRFSYKPHLEAVRVYRANLRSLVAMLKDRGVTPVLVYQPTLFDKTPWSPEERADFARVVPRYAESMRTLLPLGAQAVKAVARTEHVTSADFTRIFDGIPGSTFEGQVHQSDMGNRIIARRLFDILRPILAQQ